MAIKAKIAAGRPFTFATHIALQIARAGRRTCNNLGEGCQNAAAAVEQQQGNDVVRTLS